MFKFFHYWSSFCETKPDYVKRGVIMPGRSVCTYSRLNL
jgi:hypothetical protein